VPAPFADIVAAMKQRYRLRVRKWRRDMSGAAWQVRYGDGRVVNWIEAPPPKTPISLAIFLHEVGHHAIGFDHDWLRCEEEYAVWNWTLEQMRAAGVEPDERTLRRVELSMRYAVGQALRRGLKKVPATLARFVTRAA